MYVRAQVRNLLFSYLILFATHPLYNECNVKTIKIPTYLKLIKCYKIKQNHQKHKSKQSLY